MDRIEEKQGIHRGFWWGITLKSSHLEGREIDWSKRVRWILGKWSLGMGGG
jgi:hypothetical protein